MAPSSASRPPLGYNPEKLPRELKEYYISASPEDIAAMLDSIGIQSVEDLFTHISADVKFSKPINLPEALSYEELQDALFNWSQENNIRTSFLGDGLPQFEVPEIVPYVCSIRNLTTSYTPYQPERSQGTLLTHWIYQCCMTELTGFEAVNSSLYDRSTAIFEAICAALRMGRKADTVIVSEGIYPGDREVLETLVSDTEIQLKWIPLKKGNGHTDLSAIKQAADELGDRLAGIVFPHVNHHGLIEEVDALTNAAKTMGVKSIAVIDPMLLAYGGLKRPVDFGESGVDMIVGEGQHLGLGANFGGPGLGLFGVRYNDSTKNDIRQSPGRYVGKATDKQGKECRVMVLSTREQHIRKEKATSNICSNQAYIATIVGAAVLQRGDAGMTQACSKARSNAVQAFQKLSKLKALRFPFPAQAFFNEFVVEIPIPAKDLIAKGSAAGLHIGVDASDRFPSSDGHYLKLSFNDRQSLQDLEKLETFLAKELGGEAGDALSALLLSATQTRSSHLVLPEVSLQDLKSYYDRLGDLNISPDDTCYPLGSCTMKYNPYINDWAASLPGFADSHPQAPVEDVQGNLRLLYETQEWFKAITGLAGVTTQPVAGAQGELVGIKLFQAYHSHRGDTARDVIIIPRSAHGTNFATATMAGYQNKTVDGRKTGIVYLEADETGQIDMASLREILATQGKYVAGIMVTNPNTGGIFESQFKEMADLIHEAGGLVYMDGANMNAIAGWVDLGALGVDAVHNNLHKTWTIPHGGGGPGDAIVAVSEKLVDFLPGHQIEKQGETYIPVKPKNSIGSFHRHWGNFAHKIRCFTYLLRLGGPGIKQMSAVAVLSARYLYKELGELFPSLPKEARSIPRMHEFILTLGESTFDALEAAGIPKAVAIPRIGKLFLDFGFHAPTVAFPEVYGLMFEPTESYSKAELDRFKDAVFAIKKLITEVPQLLEQVPVFTPIDRVDEVTANRQLQLNEQLTHLPEPPQNRIAAKVLQASSIEEITQKLLAHLNVSS
jgi:glycine dehydrogenase